ncbi:CinA family protein [Orrella sp. JC864]|uniref:CinA family protein n=1 Tax=Orrella sp. JC864 TaxID=3120298 RepID=UPI00300A6D40
MSSDPAPPQSPDEAAALQAAGASHARLSFPEVLTLADVLQARLWKIAVAESCTGGLLAASLTELPGSSAWFERGFVTYSNEAKIEQLGVAPQILAEHGAVSEQVARQMATGVLAAAQQANVAVSITGIAGPGGAVPGKPVGTVCFGFAQRGPDGLLVCASTRHFDGDRAAVRAASVQYVLRTLALFSAQR